MATASIAASLAEENIRMMFLILQPRAITTKLVKWEEYQVKYDKKNDILIKKRKMWRKQRLLKAGCYGVSVLLPNLPRRYGPKCWTACPGIDMIAEQYINRYRDETVFE
jgi:hypothetical protein